LDNFVKCKDYLLHIRFAAAGKARAAFFWGDTKKLHQKIDLEA